MAKKVAKTGRRSKLTAERRKAIVEAIELGLKYSIACQAAGIDTSTFDRWRRRGEEGVEPYKAFLTELQSAEARGEQRNLAIIANAGLDEWQAAAWILERRHPERYARRERHELSGPGGGPIQTQALDLTGLSDDELVRFRQLADKAGATGGRSDAGAPGGHSPKR